MSTVNRPVSSVRLDTAAGPLIVTILLPTSEVLLPPKIPNAAVKNAGVPIAI
jgi:hypothetical protein